MNEGRNGFWVEEWNWIVWVEMNGKIVEKVWGIFFGVRIGCDC